MRFYHGSNERLDVGAVLSPRGEAYDADWKNSGFYGILEAYRPAEMTAHRDAVFMVADPDDVDLAGGGTVWIFEVEPAGPVSRHDMNWSSEICSLVSEGLLPESEEVAQAALNYWRGIPHRDENVWEYLASTATVVAVEPYDSFVAGPGTPG